MKRLMNFLQGIVVLVAAGPFPERLLNLCAQEGIDFWAVEWLDDTTLRLTTRRRTLRELYQLAERSGCTTQVEGSRGLPDFVLRFRTRYAFLVGLAISLCAVMFLSRFILTIQVTGNERVPTAVILTQLRQQGIRPGRYGPSIDRQQAAQEAVLALKEVAWMAINLHGTRLEVIVREAVPVPERVDEREHWDVIAEADGIITHVEAELGDALVKEGDTVLAGDVLIAGTVTMEPPQYSDQPNRYYQTHARGRVWARTWRTLTAAIPVEADKKVHAGETERLWALTILGRRIELWGESREGKDWEKAVSVHQAVLPGGVPLPLTLHREVYRTYEREAVPVDLEAAQALLEDALDRQLKQRIGEEGTVERQAYSARVEAGMLCVTLEAECREEIGRQVPGKTAGTDEQPAGEAG